MMPEWAPPGLPADSPVWAGVVRHRLRGRAHGDDRGHRDRRRASASPTPCAARPATTPAPPSLAATAI